MNIHRACKSPYRHTYISLVVWLFANEDITCLSWVLGSPWCAFLGVEDGRQHTAYCLPIINTKLSIARHTNDLRSKQCWPCPCKGGVWSVNLVVHGLNHHHDYNIPSGGRPQQTHDLEGFKLTILLGVESTSPCPPTFILYFHPLLFLVSTVHLRFQTFYWLDRFSLLHLPYFIFSTIISSFLHLLVCALHSISNSLSILFVSLICLA